MFSSTDWRMRDTAGPSPESIRRKRSRNVPSAPRSTHDGGSRAARESSMRAWPASATASSSAIFVLTGPATTNASRVEPRRWYACVPLAMPHDICNLMLPAGVAMRPLSLMNRNIRAVAIAARRWWLSPLNSTTIASPPNSRTSPSQWNTSSISPLKTVLRTSLMYSAPLRPKLASRSLILVKPLMSKNASEPSISVHPRSAGELEHGEGAIRHIRMQRMGCFRRDFLLIDHPC